jgi:antibiotic biosynthesis monooxygenase (ABM) superfamily enzyme
MQVNKEAMQAWARQAETKQFVEQLRGAVEEEKERWSTSGFTSEDPVKSARYNTAALARVDMLRQVITVIEEWLEEPETKETWND